MIRLRKLRLKSLQKTLFLARNAAISSADFGFHPFRAKARFPDSCCLFETIIPREFFMRSRFTKPFIPTVLRGLRQGKTTTALLFLSKQSVRYTIGRFEVPPHLPSAEFFFDCIWRGVAVFLGLPYQNISSRNQLLYSILPA